MCSNNNTNFIYMNKASWIIWISIFWMPIDVIDMKACIASNDIGVVLTY